MYKQCHNSDATSWQNVTTIEGVLCSVIPVHRLTLGGQIKSLSALILRLSHHLVAEELQIIKTLYSSVPHEDLFFLI